MMFLAPALLALTLPSALPAQRYEQENTAAVHRSYDVRLLERIGARRDLAIETRSHLIWAWEGLDGWGIPARSSLPFGDEIRGDDFAIDWLSVFDRWLPSRAIPPFGAYPIESLSSSNGTFLLTAPAETHLAVSELLRILEGHLTQSVDLGVYVFKAKDVAETVGVLLTAGETTALLESTPVLERQHHVSRTVEPAFLRETERHATLVDYFVDHSGRLVCADPLVIVPTQGLEIAIDVRPTVGGGYVARVGGRYGSALSLGRREASFTDEVEAVYDLPKAHSQVFTSTARVTGDGGSLLLGASDSEDESVRILITFKTRVAPPSGSPFVPVGGWSSAPLAIRAIPPLTDPLAGRRSPLPNLPPDPTPARKLDLEEFLEAQLGDEDLADSSPRIEWFESWALPRGQAESRAAAVLELTKRVLASERQVAFELRAGLIPLSQLSAEERASLVSGDAVGPDLGVADYIDALDLRAYSAVQVGARALTSSLDEISYVHASQESNFEDLAYSDPATATLQDGFTATVSALAPPDGTHGSLPLNVEVHLQRRIDTAVDGSDPRVPEFVKASVQSKVHTTSTDWCLIGAQEIEGLDSLFIAVLRELESTR